MTMVLPAVPILSKSGVEAAYAALVAKTSGLRAADLTKLADAIDEETSRDPPVCGPRLDAVTTLLAKIGIQLYREDFTVNGAFDACAYLVAASSILREGVAAVLGLKGLDAVAAAYATLSFTAPPMGTGPYRFVSEGASQIHLEAWPGYHGGLVTTRYLDFVPATGDGSDLVAGTVDVYQGGANPDSTFRASATPHGLTVAALPQAGFDYLAFNVRPGRLFADLNLRKALQLCIDLPGDVEAATAGSGTAVYGPVMPGTWAYDATIPRPSRNPAAARALIDAAGWKIGTDGIYAKDGVRLAAVIPVKSTDPQRVHVADLIALQARDCGMDLRGQPTKPDELFALFQYPHDLPGTKTPFDLFIGAWGNSPDPSDGFGVFVSSNVTNAANADGTTYTDFIGFRDPTLDHLLAAALSTYDQSKRAGFYREAQQALATQLPYVFLWAMNSYDVVRAAVTTVDGPLDLTAPNWAWQPERLVVEAAKP
jgi:peptide/nickel transport system substrate-binding protein